MIDPFGELARGAALLGVELTPEQMAQFKELLAMLSAANLGMNLTSVRQSSEIVARHFLESIALGVWLHDHGYMDPGTRALDLGSGAGFPGLPLKLVWTEIDLVLLEATGKKARFIESAVSGLKLASTRVLTGRAETLGHDPMLRGRFDLVLARAVAALPALVEMALPFLRRGGRLIALKGSRAPEELRDAAGALKLCGGEVRHVDLLTADGPLRVIDIEKVSETPVRYPRRPGQPVAHPLT